MIIGAQPGADARVLVTGASGFIGRETIGPLRDAGYDIHVAGRNGNAAADVTSHDIDLLEGDLDELIMRIRPSHLLHLAWYAEPGKFWHSPRNLDWVGATLRLVRAFASNGGRRAVLAGTCAEYDWSHSRLDECTTPLAPATLYGEAKASVFRILAKAAPSLDVSFAWGRIFFPFGHLEAKERLLGSLLDAAVRGEAVNFSEGLQERNFMHVDDVAAAMVHLLTGTGEGAVNIAAESPVPVREFVRLAAKLSGAEHLIKFGARPMQPGEPLRLEASTSRLIDDMGFVPKFSLKSGLRDTVRRYMASHTMKEG